MSFAIRHPLVTFALSLALPAGLLAAPPADWPGWRGPSRDGLSPDHGLLPAWTASGPPLAWTTTGTGVGFSSVAVAGDRLFTMGDKAGSQQLMAFKRSDGKPLWTARIGAPWNDEMGGPRGTPTVDGDLVYAIGTEGDLVCVEAPTGSERWRRSLARDFGGAMMSVWKFSESPLVDGDRVVVTPGGKDAALVALDKKTGKEIWRAALPDLGSRAPATLRS
jgi:outer membrane protein assembly factor BamB